MHSPSHVWTERQPAWQKLFENVKTLPTHHELRG